MDEIWVCRKIAIISIDKINCKVSLINFFCFNQKFYNHRLKRSLLNESSLKNDANVKNI